MSIRYLPNNPALAIANLDVEDVEAAYIELKHPANFDLALISARDLAFVVDPDIDTEFPSNKPANTDLALAFDYTLARIRGQRSNRALALARVLDSDLSHDPEKIRMLALGRIRKLALGLGIGGLRFRARDIDLALSPDLGLDSGLSPAALAQVLKWALKDLTEEERRILSGPKGLASGYIACLMFFWSSFVAVAWVISDPARYESANRKMPIIALEKLSPEASARSAAALEPFAGSVQKFVDDDSQPLDPTDESFLRAQLGMIREQHRIIEGADPFDIRRSIGKIIGRLLSLDLNGSQARGLLEELGADPPEVTNQIMGEMTAGLELLAEQFSDGSLDPALEPEAAAKPFVEAANIPTRIEEVASQDPDLTTRAREKFVLEAAGSAGKTIGPAAITLVGAIAMGVAGLPGVDAAIWVLIDKLPELLEIYTTRKSTKPNGDDES